MATEHASTWQLPSRIETSVGGLVPYRNAIGAGMRAPFNVSVVRRLMMVRSWWWSSSARHHWHPSIRIPASFVVPDDVS